MLNTPTKHRKKLIKRILLAPWVPSEHLSISDQRVDLIIIWLFAKTGMIMATVAMEIPVCTFMIEAIIRRDGKWKRTGNEFRRKDKSE